MANNKEDFDWADLERNFSMKSRDFRRSLAYLARSEMNNIFENRDLRLDKKENTSSLSTTRENDDRTRQSSSLDDTVNYGDPEISFSRPSSSSTTEEDIVNIGIESFQDSQSSSFLEHSFQEDSVDFPIHQIESESSFAQKPYENSTNLSKDEYSKHAAALNDSQNLDRDEDLIKASELDHKYQNNSVVISKFSKSIEEVFDIGFKEFIGDFGEKTRDYAEIMIDSLEKGRESNMQSAEMSVIQVVSSVKQKISAAESRATAYAVAEENNNSINTASKILHDDTKSKDPSIVNKDVSSVKMLDEPFPVRRLDYIAKAENERVQNAYSNLTSQLQKLESIAPEFAKSTKDNYLRETKHHFKNTIAAMHGLTSSIKSFVTEVEKEAEREFSSAKDRFLLTRGINTDKVQSHTQASDMQHTAQNKEPLFRRATAIKENDEHSLLQRHKDKPIKILGKYTQDIADERSSQAPTTKGKS
ncbi:hypothetical protein [Candidatus Lariskella endosymbiont of Hedychridium roseum]|uniref:hypothetical protein n=1 Tax=Candidatus Lariskella endosymbiont of Hedychridium roseum TaxID=3077949 RepID=UPI0030CFC3B2